MIVVERGGGFAVSVRARTGSSLRDLNRFRPVPCAEALG